MNREILFRGKRVDNGEWVYGYLVKSEDYIFDYSERIDIPYVIPIDNFNLKDYREYRVIPETIGQYTGLTNKNGKKIFEGDKVKMHYFYETFHSETLGSMEAENEVVGIVQYSHKYGVTLETDDESYTIYQYVQEPSEELEVIGNVFDEKE